MYRRQSPACLRDIQATQSQHYQDCNAVLQKFADHTAESTTDVTSFCQTNTCPSYLSGLIAKLVRDCGIPGLVITYTLLIKCAGHSLCILLYHILNYSTI